LIPCLRRLASPVGLGLGGAVLWLALLATPQPALAGRLAHPPAQPAAGRTFTVTSAADIFDLHPGDGVCDTTEHSGLCTLRAALQEVDRGPGGDTILLQAPGPYLLTQIGAANPNYDGNLDISQTVTLLGAGPDRTIIDGNSGVTGERVFDIITGTVTISGVTIQNGKAYNEGGNILNTGQLTIINSRILSGTADGLNDFGGGIASGSALTVVDNLVRGNRTGPHNSHGGGIMNFGIGPLTILSSTISENVVSDTTSFFGQGGGVMGVARIVASTLSGNQARLGGGAYLNGHSVVINSTIADNKATSAGGGLYISA